MENFGEYIAGETIALGSSKTGFVPAGATVALMRSEGGAVYYDINATTANANSAGYLPDGWPMIVGPLDNLDALAFYGAAGVKVHVQYFSGGMTRASAHVAYPNGAWDATTVAAMNAAGMLTGRGVQATFNTISQIHDYSLLRQMRLILISSSVNLDYLKDVVDEAKNQNQIIAFLTHDISGAEITKQADIVNYVVSLGMPTITISEWYALYTAAYP